MFHFPGNQYNINADLFVGTEKMLTLSTYYYGQPENHRDTVTNSFIVDCNQDQVVSVVASADFSLFGGNRSSFSGIFVGTSPSDDP